MSDQEFMFITQGSITITAKQAMTPDEEEMVLREARSRLTQMGLMCGKPQTQNRLIVIPFVKKVERYHQ